MAPADDIRSLVVCNFNLMDPETRSIGFLA